MCFCALRYFRVGGLVVFPPAVRTAELLPVSSPILLERSERYDLPCRRFLASVTELRFSRLLRISRLYSSSVTVRPCEDTGVNRPGRCLDVPEVLTRVLVAATHIGVIRPAHSRPSHCTATVIVQLVGHAHRSLQPTFPSDLIVRWLGPDISLRGSVWAWLAGDHTCVYAYICPLLFGAQV